LVTVPKSAQLQAPQAASGLRLFSSMSGLGLEVEDEVAPLRDETIYDVKDAHDRNVERPLWQREAVDSIVDDDRTASPRVNDLELGGGRRAGEAQEERHDRLGPLDHRSRLRRAIPTIRAQEGCHSIPVEGYRERRTKFVHNVDVGPFVVGLLCRKIGRPHRRRGADSRSGQEVAPRMGTVVLVHA